MKKDEQPITHLLVPVPIFDDMITLLQRISQDVPKVLDRLQQTVQPVCATPQSSPSENGEQEVSLSDIPAARTSDHTVIEKT